MTLPKYLAAGVQMMWPIDQLMEPRVVFDDSPRAGNLWAAMACFRVIRERIGGR